MSQPTSVELGAVSDTRKFNNAFVIPHHLTFTSVFNLVSKTYLTLDDEAKRHNYQNALSMRLDTFTRQLLRARQYPTVGLPFSIEVENPDDDEQKRVGEELTLAVDRIPEFQRLRLNCLDALWGGKAGCQLKNDYVTIRGRKFQIPVDHLPVSGDKIVKEWGGGWGILIYAGWNPEGAEIRQTNWGPALMLNDEFYRDRFIIHSYEPEDTDYRFAPELGGEIAGNGLRSQIYWVYQLRQEVLHWITNSLQRISTNGMMIAEFPRGNSEAQKAAVQVLKDLNENSNAAVPVDPDGSQTTSIKCISPNTVAYDVLFKALDYFDSIIQKLVLGQSLSTDTAATGMGSEVAQLHAQTFEQRIRYDANSLAETLTEQLLKPIIKYNYGSLPFHVRLRFEVEKQNVKDQITAAKALYDMGVPLDVQNLRDQAGFTAPKAENQTIKSDPVGDFRVADEGKVGDTTKRTEVKID